MSDFIYSSVPQTKGSLAGHIRSIYHRDQPEVSEFHGPWGSLGVSRNPYHGFQPIETGTHIVVVIGGPVLYFRDNRFLTGNDVVAGTAAIYERLQSGTIRWGEDLSGPFVVLVVDKITKAIKCVTDLMMFIPVFRYEQKATVMLGTHADALARAAGQDNVLDTVSLVDFILNDVVTYPYTNYTKIHQCLPATIHDIEISGKSFSTKKTAVYWQPKERNPYADINEAAEVLKKGVQNYVNRVTEGMTEVAQFLSAGEDSRVIAGLLPRELKRDAFVFLDSMNREGHIARRVARKYGVNFHAIFRSKTHYLDIMPEASDLIGSGHHFCRAHSLGLHKTCNLARYTAVFGGYLSDVLLKGLEARKIRSFHTLRFVPQSQKKNYLHVETKNVKKGTNLFKFQEEIIKRRSDHLADVSKNREGSSGEWFNFWPMSMRAGVGGYLNSNRRLFRSYEPFTCKEVVKISSAIPVKWKLNGRLFNKAFRPALRPSCWIFHADGRLPYFPWWVNTPIQCLILLNRLVGTRAGIFKGNQGPWVDWDQIIDSKKWKGEFFKYGKGLETVRRKLMRDEDNMYKEGNLTKEQKRNLLEVIYFLSTKSI